MPRLVAIVTVVLLLAGCSSAHADRSPISLQPTESASASPKASQSSAAPSTSGVASPSQGSSAPSMPAPPLLEPGYLVQVTDGGLRVRSKPSVEADSLKYTPLLEAGTSLSLVDGPVAGSGLWWYRVRLDAALDGGQTEGWVAAGDRHGATWIEDLDQEVWEPVARGGVQLIGATRLSQVDWLIHISVAGLPAGSNQTLAMTADYTISWDCFAPDAGSDIGGGIVDAVDATGRATDEVGLVVAADGTGSARLHLVAPRPDRPCTFGYEWGSMQGDWTGTLRASFWEQPLAVPPYWWETTF
jgi:hypothetical protein